MEKKDALAHDGFAGSTLLQKKSRFRANEDEVEENYDLVFEHGDDLKDSESIPSEPASRRENKSKDESHRRERSPVRETRRRASPNRRRESPVRSTRESYRDDRGGRRMSKSPNREQYEDKGKSFGRRGSDRRDGDRERERSRDRYGRESYRTRR